MKKENIYVKVNTEKECKNYRKILKQLGEPISDIYFENFDPETKSHCNLVFCLDGDWTMGALKQGEKITFGQLIDLLNEPKKLAVKVENEKEFKALMKYYDSLGWKSAHTLPDKFNVEEHEAVDFHDSYHWDSVKVQSGKYAYQIIPFAEFAKKNEIKLPLIVSEDGIDLYEGDNFFSVRISNYDIVERVLTKDWAGINSGNLVKGFRTKQAALSWIDAQKPKETVLQFGAYKFTVKKDSVNVSHGDSDTFVDINSIYKAFLELN